MNRALKNRLKRLSRQLFEGAQRFGLDVLPHHFYSQIPNIAELRGDSDWQAPRSMVGVSGCDIEAQLSFVADCCPPELSRALPGLEVHGAAKAENGADGYGFVEAEFLHCFVKRHRPRRIVQVGCGVSTSIVLRAARDAGYEPEVVCIEPYPTPFLEQADREGRIRLVKEKAQQVELGILADLSANDLLFVDSTHTVKPGSEVNRILLEVMPRLGKSVWVHFHDIYFPYDYRRNLMEGDLFFWLESTMLHAVLVQNPRYTIRAALSMIHYARPSSLQALFTGYQPQSSHNGLKAIGGKHFPSALYLQVV